ncbi:hypothetical protein F0L74_28840 [Chitinophaga agrisoli]|uniref:Uncharacterized protein n=1 Tax=Chitinophaga agrisoli TaxID=2607653 RepID=A0A5B2VPN3_9BACT|nr:hypothetical protein [Chitinophaga agrisoli]KAA2240177.1 hypothetical protein F0L74_28840 [Chitinophaga agrisoli]
MQKRTFWGMLILAMSSVTAFAIPSMKAPKAPIQALDGRCIQSGAVWSCVTATNPTCKTDLTHGGTTNAHFQAGHVSKAACDAIH